jgi:hypothetical protein
MSFEDRMKKILPVLQGIYSPYITRSGRIPQVNDPTRSDYDDMTGRSVIHGGVDIIYGKIVGGALTYIGSNDLININAIVKAPVTGKIVGRSKKWGGLSILGDDDGYVHTIYHMKLSNLQKGVTVTEGVTELGVMSSVKEGS